MPPSSPQGLSKPVEFEMFDAYFDKGPELGARLQSAAEGITADGSDGGNDDVYWGGVSGSNGKTPAQAKEHFEQDWIGGSAFAGDGGDELYHKLRVAVRDAAQKALKDGSTKQLEMVLDNGGYKQVETQIIDGPSSVLIVVKTPKIGG